jgi:heme/copper-type cytochrome/quinol oxidase subunit 2
MLRTIFLACLLCSTALMVLGESDESTHDMIDNYNGATNNPVVRIVYIVILLLVLLLVLLLMFYICYRFYIRHLF